MDIKSLKSFLYDNPDKIIKILEELNFHSIKTHSGTDDDYITCGNPDGDNKTAVTIYLTPSLLTINYTRTISADKNSSDFIDLVSYQRGEGFFENLKWLADFSGVGYYHNFAGNVPESLRIIKKLREMLHTLDTSDEEDNIPVTVKDKSILDYYRPYANQMFEDDGISVGTQREFEVGYDGLTNRITIPIFDEIGNLVGVKGRYFERGVPDNELKYYYLEKCPRHRILYGYNFTKPYIEKSKQVIVYEAEKSVMQSWSYGYKNGIATMGKKISAKQIDKLNRLGKSVILAFDKDVKIEELEEISKRFIHGIKVYALYDSENTLDDKESPTDNKEKFVNLITNNLIEMK